MNDISGPPRDEIRDADLRRIRDELAELYVTLGHLADLHGKLQQMIKILGDRIHVATKRSRFDA